MARIFITGSADGLGQLAAKTLIGQGHRVMLHARNKERGAQALKKLPGAEGVLVADLSSMEETKALAGEANASGAFDSVIHNAGLYQVPRDSVGAEGFSLLFTVNTLAPYMLTCLMHKPGRLIYLSSGMHRGGDATLNHLPVSVNDRKQHVSYSDTKLHDLILSMAVAATWTDVYANAVDPGWVPTKMGGAHAPDNLERGFETQVWLATSNDPGAKVSGRYFHHKQEDDYLAAAGDAGVQQKLLAVCEQLTRVRLDDRR